MVANPEGVMQGHFHVCMTELVGEVLVEVCSDPSRRGDIQIMHHIDSSDVQIVFVVFLASSIKRGIVEKYTMLYRIKPILSFSLEIIFDFRKP